MLLDRIVTDPDRFQFREAAFSEKTVAAIVAEGIDLAKFSPIPVVPAGRGLFCVAGDGHSRFEAIRRLAAEHRLPTKWRTAEGWDIPCKSVTLQQARTLAWTANMSRDNLTPAEEAAVFQDMLDAGKTREEIARMAHRKVADVTWLLSLNLLCPAIRAAVGKRPEAGGLDVSTATTLARGFQRHGIDHAQQHDLWHKCLKHSMLNFQSAKRFIELVGSKLAARSGDDALFELPANATAVLDEARQTVAAARKARAAVSALLSAYDAGALAELPELAAWVEAHGDASLSKLDAQCTADGAALAGLFAA